MGKNLDSPTLPFLGKVFEKFYLAGVNPSDSSNKVTVLFWVGGLVFWKNQDPTL
jgi:hypothetical protein